MSDREISAASVNAALEARRDGGLWSPGLRLVQHRAPRVKGLWLLLLSWLVMLLLAMLALHWAVAEVSFGMSGEGIGPLRDIADTAGPFIHRLPPGVLVLALLAALYLAVCAWMSLADAHATEGGAANLGHGPAREPDDEGPAQLPGDRNEAGAHRHCRRELSDVHLALHVGHQQVGAAIGETARRTISLCGAFDSCAKHAEVASADLDAIQDEAAHAQQVMANLRAHLLSLSGHCQALASAAPRSAESAAAAGAAQGIDELLEAVGAEIVHCHHLSERIGGAGRSGRRRIDSLRRCIEGLGHQADRGLREGHQVMVLTRQIEAALAEGAKRLEQLAACVAPDGQGGAQPAQPQVHLPVTEGA